MSGPVDAPTAHDEDDGGDAAAYIAPTRGTTFVRLLLIGVGSAVGVYGGWLLWEFPTDVLVRFAVWAGVGVVVHDFVFAPLCAGLGFAGRRLIRGRWWTPVSVAAVCSVVLALLAVPVFSKPGAHADNPSVLDRNYPLGLLVALVVVWACVPIYVVIGRLLPVRQDEVVEQQRTDDVESEPPAV